MSELITLDREYTTGEKWEVRVLMIDAGGSHPVIAAVREASGIWSVYRWTATGKWPSILHPGSEESRANPLDLIPAPRKHTGFLSIYMRDGKYAAGFYPSRIAADAASFQGNRIACVPVTFPEGEGL